MGPYRKELRALLVLAFPIVSGHLLQMSMGFVDTVMVGPLGANATAAVGLASAVIGLVLVFGFGLCTPVHVFASAAHAAGEKEEASRVLVHGLFITGIFGIGLGALIHANIHLLERFSQDPEVVQLAKPFVILAMWSAAPALMGACLRNYCEALGRPWVPFWTLVIMVPANVLLNYLLIFGKAGFPALGVTGAALGTLIARLLQMALTLAFIFYSKQLRPTGFQIWRIRAQRVKTMLGVGIPTSFQIFAESGAFAILAIFAGMISAKAQAAHQICQIMGSMSFMLPLGFGAAATIRIGYAVGRNDPLAIKRVMRMSYLAVIVCMSAYALFVIALRQTIPHWFTQDAEVIQIAAVCLFWGALMALSDGTQSVGICMLRGLRDVKVSSIVAAILYWGVGLPASWIFAFTLNKGAPGLWMGLFLVLTLVSIFAFLRLQSNIRRRIKVL